LIKVIYVLLNFVNDISIIINNISNSSTLEIKYRLFKFQKIERKKISIIP